MNPEVNKILQKFSTEDPDKLELNKIFVNLAMSTDQLVKEINEEYDHVNATKPEVEKLAYSLRMHLHEEFLGSSTMLDLYSPNVDSKIDDLKKVSKAMQDAELDTGEVERQLKLLEDCKRKIKEGTQIGEKVYNDIINKLKV